MRERRDAACFGIVRVHTVRWARLAAGLQSRRCGIAWVQAFVPCSADRRRSRATHGPIRYDGLVGPGSVMWAVHGDAATIVGGLRALLVQTLHPLVMAGVADHSDYRSDPLGRLHRTVSFLGDVVFGSTAEADAAVEAVKKMHRRVTGVAPDGRPYSADDPHLLSWVHCTLVESFWQCRVRYGAAPLPSGSADGYVAEMAEIGRRLGAEDPPTDASALRARLTAFIPELDVSHQAREATRFLLWPQVPISARMPYTALLGAAIGTLPDFARRMLGVQVPRLAHSLMAHPSAVLVLRVLGWALGPHPEIAAAEAACKPTSDETASEHSLGDLNGVERGPFAQVVPRHEQ